MLSKKKPVYPSKTTVNLLIREKTGNSLSRVIPAVLILALFITAFTRFAVLAPLARASEAEAKAAELETALTLMRIKTSGYSDLLIEYGRYTYGGMNETELALADRLELLTLIEGTLLPRAQINSVTAADNVLSLILSGVTLEEISDLIVRLHARPIVQEVSVSAANGNPGEAPGATIASATMTITLYQEGGGDR